MPVEQIIRVLLTSLMAQTDMVMLSDCVITTQEVFIGKAGVNHVIVSHKENLNDKDSSV